MDGKLPSPGGAGRRALYIVLWVTKENRRDGGVVRGSTHSFVWLKRVRAKEAKYAHARNTRVPRKVQ